jgi:hypothetical protein
MEAIQNVTLSLSIIGDGLVCQFPVLKFADFRPSSRNVARRHLRRPPYLSGMFTHIWSKEIVCFRPGRFTINLDRGGNFFDRHPACFERRNDIN